ncbi:hypothetical protein Tco_1231207, partial [Tanacetum coccineum]
MEKKQIVYDQIPPLSADHQWIVAQNLDAEDETEVQIFYSVHDPLCHFRCQIPELLGKYVINLPRVIYKQSDSDDDDDDIEYCCLTSPPDDP